MARGQSPFCISTNELKTDDKTAIENSTIRTALTDIQTSIIMCIKMCDNIAN